MTQKHTIVAKQDTGHCIDCGGDNMSSFEDCPVKEGLCADCRENGQGITEFCPKHAAADQMLTALEQAVNNWRYGFGILTTTEINTMQQAIDSARGKGGI